MFLCPKRALHKRLWKMVNRSSMSCCSLLKGGGVNSGLWSEIKRELRRTCCKHWSKKSLSSNREIMSLRWFWSLKITFMFFRQPWTQCWLKNIDKHLSLTSHAEILLTIVVPWKHNLSCSRKKQDLSLSFAHRSELHCFPLSWQCFCMRRQCLLPSHSILPPSSCSLSGPQCPAPGTSNQSAPGGRDRIALGSEQPLLCSHWTNYGPCGLLKDLVAAGRNLRNG